MNNNIKNKKELNKNKPQGPKGKPKKGKKAPFYKGVAKKKGK
jgi:hypothetical protein